MSVRGMRKSKLEKLRVKIKMPELVSGLGRKRNDDARARRGR